MTLRLYDTKAQALRDFVPQQPGRVSMYVCGPTVQSAPHLGHLRGALAFDLLSRWLEREVGPVIFVRNVTDIDDKVLAVATDSEPWWAVAYRVERAFNQAYAAIGVRPPTYEPRATGSIPQMIELIQTLLERGHAYVAGDGSGDVYFDVRSWSAYGALTHQSPDALERGDDTPTRAKKDPLDFALWKGAKPAEPATATWSAPWGAGRPGWHIECSAMARRYLGESFDIHGGGLDLRFPHHENELAQSTAAGDGFAQYWVHNGLVTVGDQKMAKSVGNSVFAADILRDNDPLVVRYALASAHYRSTLDIAPTSFAEADAALNRIRAMHQRLARSGGVVEPTQLPAAFVTAMNDDLGVPQALAVVHEAVRDANSALDAGDTAAARVQAGQVRAMTGVLGLDPLEDPGAATGAEAEALDAVMRMMIDQRAHARETKDWATADRIRDAIAAGGISLEDGPSGTHWSIDRG